MKVMVWALGLLVGDRPLPSTEIGMVAYGNSGGGAAFFLRGGTGDAETGNQET